MRKLYHLLKPKIDDLGISMGRDKFFELCGRLGLSQKPKKRRKTGDNILSFVTPNLLKNLVPIRKNLIWYTDITYLKIKDKHAYLSLIIDHYSRKIIGWNLANNMETNESIKALNMAIWNSDSDLRGLIHHSDRGSQYRSADYNAVLNKHNITQSMTDGGKPYQNAINERINGILKHEFNLVQAFDNWTKMQNTVNNAINAYNNLRPHTALNFNTPSQLYA